MMQISAWVNRYVELFYLPEHLCQKGGTWQPADIFLDKKAEQSELCSDAALVYKTDAIIKPYTSQFTMTIKVLFRQ